MAGEALSYPVKNILNRFCVAGINYHKADTSIRGLFSVDDHCYRSILHAAKENDLYSVFVLSTCNRTEIYGYANDINLLVQLLTAHTTGNREEFQQHAYLKTGNDALQHLFEVAAGIDSQILGDYEIAGQMKRAVEFARQHEMVGPVMARTLSFVLQASKKVKKDTALSSGTVSVSYAPIELLKELPGIAEKRVLVLGAGKMGESVCKNIKSYLRVRSFSVINRTLNTAKNLAERLHIEYASFDTLPEAIKACDILILCTHAEKPIVLPGHLMHTSEKLVIDLSIPVNVHRDVRKLSTVRVIDVDEISTTILDKTFSKRQSEVPKAFFIIEEHKSKFLTWLAGYEDAKNLGIWRAKLELLTKESSIFGEAIPQDDDNIQKAINGLALRLRSSRDKGCAMIHAVNEYLELSAVPVL